MGMQPIILYVEDNTENRLLVRRILQAEGFQVLEAEDAFRAVERIKSTRPDLILMDVNLGLSSYDGVRLAKTLARLREPGERTPLIFLHSARPAAELQALQRTCGADGFLEKGDLQLLPVRVKQG